MFLSSFLWVGMRLFVNAVTCTRETHDALRDCVAQNVLRLALFSGTRQAGLGVYREPGDSPPDA